MCQITEQAWRGIYMRSSTELEDIYNACMSGPCMSPSSRDCLLPTQCYVRRYWYSEPVHTSETWSPPCFVLAASILSSPVNFVPVCPRGHVSTFGHLNIYTAELPIYGAYGIF